jgi:hypothetical protein
MSHEYEILGAKKLDFGRLQGKFSRSQPREYDIALRPLIILKTACMCIQVVSADPQ